MPAVGLAALGASASADIVLAPKPEDSVSSISRFNTFRPNRDGSLFSDESLFYELCATTMRRTNTTASDGRHISTHFRDICIYCRLPFYKKKIMQLQPILFLGASDCVTMGRSVLKVHISTHRPFWLNTASHNVVNIGSGNVLPPIGTTTSHICFIMIFPNNVEVYTCVFLSFLKPHWVKHYHLYMYLCLPCYAGLRDIFASQYSHRIYYGEM